MARSVRGYRGAMQNAIESCRVPVPPNDIKLSGERKRVRCNEGLGGAATLTVLTMPRRATSPMLPRWLAAQPLLR
jgi:hypothetical protein